MRWGVYIAAGAAAAFVAASAAERGSPSAASAPPQRYPIVVTRDDASLPTGCRPAEVAALVWDFFDAFNSGDGRRMAGIIEPEAGPADVTPRGWYSVTEGNPLRGGRHFVAYNQGDTLHYFARRHRRHERLALLELDVGPGSTPDGVGVGYRVDRRADDLRRIGIRNHIATGKAAIDCRQRRIYVWSMAMSTRPVRGQGSCPAPTDSDSVPRRRTVACSRGGG